MKSVEYKILPTIMYFLYNEPIYFGIYKITTRKFLFWNIKNKILLKTFSEEVDAIKALELYKNYN